MTWRGTGLVSARERSMHLHFAPAGRLSANVDRERYRPDATRLPGGEGGVGRRAGRHLDAMAAVPLRGQRPVAAAHGRVVDLQGTTSHVAAVATTIGASHTTRRTALHARAADHDPVAQLEPELSIDHEHAAGAPSRLGTIRRSEDTDDLRNRRADLHDSVLRRGRLWRR